MEMEGPAEASESLPAGGDVSVALTLLEAVAPEIGIDLSGYVTARSYVPEINETFARFSSYFSSVTDCPNLEAEILTALRESLATEVAAYANFAHARDFTDIAFSQKSALRSQPLSFVF